MTDERCKQIMEQLGMPNSRSLMQALFQVANETEQEVRKKLASDNNDYASALCEVIDDCIDEHYRETVKSVSDIAKEIQRLNASHFA